MSCAWQVISGNLPPRLKSGGIRLLSDADSTKTESTVSATFLHNGYIDPTLLAALLHELVGGLIAKTYYAIE